MRRIVRVGLHLALALFINYVIGIVVVYGSGAGGVAPWWAPHVVVPVALLVFAVALLPLLLWDWAHDDLVPWPWD